MKITQTKRNLYGLYRLNLQSCMKNRKKATITFMNDLLYSVNSLWTKSFQWKLYSSAQRCIITHVTKYGGEWPLCVHHHHSVTLMIPNIHCHKMREVYHPNETVFSSKSHWNEDDDDVVLFSSCKARSITWETVQHAAGHVCYHNKKDDDDAPAILSVIKKCLLYGIN